MLDKESKAPTGNMPSKTISLKHVEQMGVKLVTKQRRQNRAVSTTVVLAEFQYPACTVLLISEKAFANRKGFMGSLQSQR